MTGRWLAGLLILVFCGCQNHPSRTWPETLSWVRATFPAVEQISTGDLARRLEASDGRAPVLIDVRSRREYAVSHLEAAQRAESVDAVETLVHGDRSTPIVLYCSVGYRSSQLAEALSEAGFTHVQNLEGSIFKWADEGRPVYRDGRRIDEVDPYDEDWGQLLDRSLWPKDRPAE